MKKGLLSLLVVALTVVGCQDYDDQFDSLNKEILALKTDLTSIKGLSASITAISSEIKALEGKMVTDSDITGILTQIAAVKTAVAALPAPADVSGITTEVADLNSEIATILEQLTKIQAASGGTYAGNLNITNAVQLTAAEDIVDSSADGPKMTITGNVYIDADNTGTKEAANILRIQAILDKLKVVSGNVSLVGIDTAMTAPELLYVTGGLEVEGSSSMGLPKLNTVDGAVELNLYGDLSYPLLGTATGGVTLSGAVASITTVDLSGLSVGVVTTEQSSLTLTKATSVKVGSLPASVTLAEALEVEAHGTADLGAMSMSAPKATAVTILAAKLTGVVTVTAKIADITMAAKESTGVTMIEGSTVALDAFTKFSAGLTVSATTLSAPLLKTAGSTMTLVNITTAAFPEMTSMTATFTGAKVSSFTAPKLATYGQVTDCTIDIKDGASISLKSLTSTYTLNDDSVVKNLTLASQGTDLVLDTMVALKTLNYTSSVIGGTLTISSTLVTLTTVNLGSTSKLTTLTVSGSVLTSLSTAGVILNANITHNTALATLDFNHTHLDGEDATTVDIINNDKLTSLDMSSLGKVKNLEITGNASLTTFVAPSVANKAEPTVTIAISFTGNDITGTYSPTIAATESSPEVPWIASSAAIASLKTFIDGYSSTQTVTFYLDVDRILLGASDDGKYNDGTFENSHGSYIDTAAELAKF